jgi:hypothetical protein
MCKASIEPSILRSHYPRGLVRMLWFVFLVGGRGVRLEAAAWLELHFVSLLPPN